MAGGPGLEKMLIYPQHEGAPGLDFETWESNNSSVAMDRSPEIAEPKPIPPHQSSLQPTTVPLQRITFQWRTIEIGRKSETHEKTAS
jgi:hypothetical protein